MTPLKLLSRISFPRLDVRAIAAFRVCIGLCALVEWSVAFSYRREFLQDDGMLSRKALFDMQWDEMYRRDGISIYQAAGSAEAVAVLLCLQLAATLCLIVGYRTWSASMLVLAFLQSWDTRLASKGAGGIEVLSVFALWAALLPLGAVCSVDALLRREETRERPNKGIAVATSIRDMVSSAAVPLHMVVMYYCCGVSKQGGRLWDSGNAVLMVLKMGEAVNEPFGTVVGSLPSACWLLTHATIIMEKYVGLLLLAPSQSLRALALALLIPFHLGMHLSLDIGTFQTQMIACLVLLTPTFVCDYLEALFYRHCWDIPVAISGSRRNAIAYFRKCRRFASTGLAHVGLLSVTLVSLLLVLTATTDMCRHLESNSEGKSECWGIPVLSHQVRDALRPWQVLLGPPQMHAPFSRVGSLEFHHHVVGILPHESAPPTMAAENENDGEGANPPKGQAIALFRHGHFVLDGMPWDPLAKYKINQKWFKFFHSPRGYKAYAAHLTVHLCDRWRAEGTGARLEGVATMRVSRDYTNFEVTGLPYGDRPELNVLSYFQCDSPMTTERCEIPPLLLEVAGNSSVDTSGRHNCHHTAGHTPVHDAEITVQNDDPRGMRAYWVQPGTGEEIYKTTIRAGQHWTQLCQVGHSFKFYHHDLRGNDTAYVHSEARLAHIIHVNPDSNDYTFN